MQPVDHVVLDTVSALMAGMDDATRRELERRHGARFRKLLEIAREAGVVEEEGGRLVFKSIPSTEILAKMEEVARKRGEKGLAENLARLRGAVEKAKKAIMSAIPA